MHKQSHAFALVELTIVLLILSIFIGGGIMVGKAKLEHEERESTQQKMQLIGNMLVNFVATNGRLPCPADFSTTQNDTNFGMERITNLAGGPQSCVASADNIYAFADNLEVAYMGAIPFKTLSLSNDFLYDAWGNKFSYVVQRSFINNEGLNTSCLNANNAADLHTSNGYLCFRAQASGSVNGGNVDINIKQNYGGNTITQDAVFVIISHGKNGLGAWRDQQTGTSPRNDLPSFAVAINERDNTNCIPSSNVCSNTALADTNFAYSNGNATAESFDDIVLFKTRNQVVYNCNASYQQSCIINFGIDMR